MGTRDGHSESNGYPSDSTTTTEIDRRTYERERKRAYRATQPKALRPFAGVDGEGGNTVDGSHVYLLLRAGTSALETGRPLTSRDCLDFLSQLRSDVEWVSYFFDYDVTMICRDLPIERVSRLLDRESRGKAKDGTKLRQVMPVDVHGSMFQIDYLPRKFFKVRKRIPIFSGFESTSKPQWSKWVTISDVGSFFQQSFLKSIDQWGVGQKYREQIERGKALRAGFGAMTDEIREYNRLECVMLAELMEAFRNVCRETGYVPSHWQGPGYLAVSMLRAHGISRTRDLPAIPAQVWDAANQAYYGGRFETSTSGGVSGPVYQYDINSAYPFALLNLPCLEHGQWHYGDNGGEFVLHRGHFEPVSPAMFYGFPVRDKDGGIYCPAEGNGWYWSVEVKSAIHQRFVSRESWSYVGQCACTPFSWVREVYAQRLALGKSGKGKVLKLGLNSLYGKMAQSIGGAPYANPIWASLITAMVRAKLAEAVHSSVECRTGVCGVSCHMLATDAVFTSERLPLQCSSDLGAWDFTEHASLFIVQPGVYWTDKRDAPKTRGIPQAKVVEHAQEFEDAFRDLLVCGSSGPVNIPLVAFVGLRAAWHRRRYELAGQWIEVAKDISFDWSSKRDADITMPTEPDMGHIRTLPIRGHKDLVSVPYSKEIGRWRDLERIDAWDQPDWGSDLFVEGLI